MRPILISTAKALGVRLTFAKLPTGVRAVYLDDQDMIVVNDELDPIQVDETVAHELGHRRFRDRCSARAAEDRAWRYAAKLLIAFDEYLRAELLDPHPLAIARELGTTRRIVELYQQHHLQSQAMRAPRTIFGSYEDDGDDDALEWRHSLATPAYRSACGLAS